MRSDLLYLRTVIALMAMVALGGTARSQEAGTVGAPPPKKAPERATFSAEKPAATPPVTTPTDSWSKDRGAVRAQMSDHDQRIGALERAKARHAHTKAKSKTIAPKAVVKVKVANYVTKTQLDKALEVADNHAHGLTENEAQERKSADSALGKRIDDVKSTADKALDSVNQIHQPTENKVVNSMPVLWFLMFIGAAIVVVLTLTLM